MIALPDDASLPGLNDQPVNRGPNNWFDRFSTFVSTVGVPVLLGFVVLLLTWTYDGAKNYARLDERLKAFQADTREQLSRIEADTRSLAQRVAALFAAGPRKAKTCIFRLSTTVADLD